MGVAKGLRALAAGFGMLLGVGAAFGQASHVTISQLYGSGGNSGALFSADFIELFNPTSSDVDMSGWSVQYTSANGSFSATSNRFTFPSGATIHANSYFLIKTTVAAGAAPSVGTPDIDTSTASPAVSINMSGASGKVVLISNNTYLTGTCGSGSNVVDFVGYGTVNCSEGSATGAAAAPGQSAAVADIRASGGCVDSDNNAADFASGTPNPRNSSSSTHSCASAQPPAGSGTASPSAACPSVPVTLTFTVIPGIPANPIAGVVGDGTAIGAGVINFVNTSGNTWSAANVTIDPAIAPGAKSIPVTITESADSGGTGSGAIGVTVSTCTFGIATGGTGFTPAATCEGTPITFTVAIRKNQITPPGNSTGIAVTLDLSPLNGVDATPMTDLGDEAGSPNFRDFSYTYLTPTGLDVGEYTVFIHATDDQGNSASGSFNPTLEDCVSSNSDIVISQFYGGGGATTGTPTFNVDYVELFNRSEAPVAIDGWTIQYASAAGPTSGAWNVSSALAGTIPAGGYYLVSMTQPAGSLGAALPIAADATPATALSMSATDGKLALVTNATALTAANPMDASIKDLLGYGSATGHEGDAAAPVLTNQLALFRLMNGCQDFDQNGADFATGTPAPRNSATAPNFCNGAPTGSCCAAAGTCSVTTQAACMDTWTSGGVCDPNTCAQPSAGVCCRGSTCSTSFTNATDCAASLVAGQAAGASFATSASCNGSGSQTTPCCYGDYNKANGISVQDIFDFLADWFAGSPYASVGGDGSPATLMVQDIFDFLAAWFAGGC